MVLNNEDKIENKWGSFFVRLFLLLILIALLTSSVIFIGWLNRPGNFQFNKVELVNHLENQQSKNLQKIAAKALNGGFFSLDVAEFRAELLANLPWVKSVAVRKIWPDKLLVEINEYKPVVRWHSEGSLLRTAEGSLLKQAKGYQLMSQEGVIFQPELTAAQKLNFDRMALFFGPKMSAKEVLEKSVAINSNLEQLGLILKQCGMNKRRTWRLMLTSVDHKQRDNIEMSIKLGKENIMQKVDRFIQVFSGKLERYLEAVEYADLRYSNGLSIKWNTDNSLQHTVQNDL